MSLLKRLLVQLTTGHSNNNSHYTGQKTNSHHGRYGNEKHNNTTSAYYQVDTQICFACQENNPISAKFCSRCGRHLSLFDCKQCGFQLSANNKFCSNCGNPAKVKID